MADDERSASPNPVFDPGDSSQVRKAVQGGYVPPAPKVPALKAPAPRPEAKAVPKLAVPKPKPKVEPPEVPKAGHVRAALEAPPEEEVVETSGVRSADADEAKPRLPIDADAKRRATMPARRSTSRDSGLETLVDESAEGDAIEPEPFPTRSSVDIEVPEAFDDPSSHSMRLSLPNPIARFGRYDVLGRVATGGMAEIYLAQEPMLGGGIRIVVVKVLRKQLANDEDFEQLFLREGRVAMQLSHPHISTVFEFGKWGGHFFIAMEYVEGATLKEILERVALHGEKLEPEVAVGIVAKVASALDYAHTARDARRASLGVVHRDVSPHNLMVRFDGVVKLLDFGVAKVAQSEDESRSDAVKGKFGYLAPEQCRAESVDGRADVFALGVCLWEAITGRRLYKRGSQFDTFRAILEEPPPSIRELDPSLPEDLDEIVRKALAKEPGNRFAAAGEMQEALEQWISNRGAIVTAARLRRAMGELFADEIRSGPRLEADTKVRERLRATSVHPPLSTSERPPPPDAALDDAPAAEAPSRPGWVLPVAAIVLLAALGAGAFFALRSPEPTGPSAAELAARDAERAERETERAENEARAAAAREETARAAAEREAAAADRAAAERAAAQATVEREAAERAAAEAAERQAAAEEQQQQRGRREPRTERRRPGFVADPGF
ncbi:MAG: serine/threonine protein kinase [Sandaracinus sp.]|nr:serine/threonine protein kinase [Sandaracinus sp.]